MTVHTPRSLTRFCREGLPALLRAARGGRMLQAVAEIVETDRWNSFDRFHETTRTLGRRYEEGGAEVEVYPVQTGGRIGSGRWIIQEAAEVRAATVDVVRPVRQRLLDYRENPWHVIQWSTGTPREGRRCGLVVLDSREEIEQMPRDGLVGKVVLTRSSPRGLLKTLADKGAVGVITDRSVANLPDALEWTKFGWGAIPMESATARLVGFVLSENQGKKLRKLAQEHGDLTLHIRADIRKYVGHHDVVCGLVKGTDDPQDEVWALAHSAEPGALDNASGGAVCLEIAQVLEELIAAGRLKRPRRTIRLLSAYECYGFFAYLERTQRLQTPLAGVCIDTIGSRPQVCDGRLEWHATIPMSAGFVDRVGEAVIRAAVRRHKPGYRLFPGPFVSTSDTLIGDPKYGFPCPWITTHHRTSGRGFDAYHSSADTVKLLSARGLEACAAAMAGYLYFLADMGSREVVELATWETQRTLARLEVGRRKIPSAEATYVRDAHRETMERLKRWMWGGDRNEILGHLEDCERQVGEAGTKAGRQERKRQRVPVAARKVPRRTAVLSPTRENTPGPIAERISAAGLNAWALFWADGRRSIAEIAAAAACEANVGKKNRRKKVEVDLDKAVEYFEGHEELGYVELIDPKDMVKKSHLVADLRKLGLKAGMDVIVHSSLSAIGNVEGGADAVIDALLAVIGKSGTLLMPSFNHRAAQVYNLMTTPTTNGAIPDAMWRRKEAVRSAHPTHAVAAIGPKAEEYCRDHIEAGIWAQDSPIGKLVHGGGHILTIGTSHHSSSAYHVAEMSVPCTCIDPFANTDEVVMPDGAVQKVRGWAFRSEECPVAVHRLDETLDRRGLQRRGKVGKEDAELVKAIDLWQVRREHLRRACPTCRIKPAIRR